MKILFTPNATGSGHNMRALALATALRQVAPTVELAVLLDSMQTTFTDLFRAQGVAVHDTATTVVNHATHSHLTAEMDWSGYIAGYLVPTFFNGGRILEYLARFSALDPDLVVSDYNTTASVAAAIAGRPHVLVTERFDFTIGQLDDGVLERAGFRVNRPDLARARAALREVFQWIVRDAAAVLTDKPYLAELDDGTPVADALSSGKARFTGPMIRPVPQDVDQAAVRASLGLGPGPVVVASVGGTTMFLENKHRVITSYLEAFEVLRKERPDLQLVLLGREKVPVPEGVLCLDYLPEWMPLLRTAELLLSAPGWITVSEVAALRVPTVFVLGDLREYHEVEAVRRLARLGAPTCVGADPELIADTVREVLDGQWAGRIERAYRSLAPDGSGTLQAAAVIANALPSAGSAPARGASAPARGASAPARGASAPARGASAPASGGSGPVV